jgi:hypothetical protein
MSDDVVQQPRRSASIARLHRKTEINDDDDDNNNNDGKHLDHQLRFLGVVVGGEAIDCLFCLFCLMELSIGSFESSESTRASADCSARFTAVAHDDDANADDERRVIVGDDIDIDADVDCGAYSARTVALDAGRVVVVPQHRAAAARTAMDAARSPRACADLARRAARRPVGHCRTSQFEMK